MYFLQLESWLGLNVFLFLFCPGLPNLYFLSIWRSQCYTFFLAEDREQQRGRPGTENRALFCAVTLFGHPKPAPFQPAGARCRLSAEQSRRAALPTPSAARAERPRARGGRRAGAEPSRAPRYFRPSRIRFRPALPLFSRLRTARLGPDQVSASPRTATGLWMFRGSRARVPPGAEEGARRALAVRRARAARRPVPRQALPRPLARIAAVPALAGEPWGWSRVVAGGRSACPGRPRARGPAGAAGAARPLPPRRRLLPSEGPALAEGDAQCRGLCLLNGV